MSSVTSINAKRRSDYRYYLNQDSTVPEWVVFAAGVTLTLVLLPFFSSIAFGAFSLFTLILICQTIGTFFGVGLFGARSEEVRLTCFPLGHIPQVAKTADTSDLKKAA
jgi:hypothetical protein